MAKKLTVKNHEEISVPTLSDAENQEVGTRLIEKKGKGGVYLTSETTQREIDALMANVPVEYHASVKEQLQHNSLPAQKMRLEKLLANIERSRAYERERMGKTFRKPNLLHVEVSSDLEVDGTGITSTEEMDNSTPTREKYVEQKGRANVTTLVGLGGALLEYCSSDECPAAPEKRNALAEKLLSLLEKSFPKTPDNMPIGNQQLQYWLGLARKEASKMNIGNGGKNSNKQRRNYRA